MSASGGTDTASFEGKRLLVTGAAGFLGSHLCEKLLLSGGRVIAVDNFITGRKKNLAHLFGDPDFEWIEQDITRPMEIDGKLSGIFHMASPASPVDYAKYPIETLRVGALGAENILALARQRNCPVLIASTSEVYGDPLQHPQTESYWGNVNPIGPRGCYDESKRYQEALAMAYQRVHGVPIRIVRIFNTYGPRMRANDGRVVPNFCLQALRGEPLTVYGDGAQTRSFCYVEDLLNGIVKLFSSPHCEPVNIGNPEEHSILEFATRIISLTGSKSAIVHRPLPVDDPKVRCPDIRKARQLLGWEPVISLDEGLKKTIDYFRREQQAEAGRADEDEAGAPSTDREGSVLKEF
ncbi:MAG TPA: UDP-glucuronic acid decarboxylase family protein [Verrucomicrobiae bacterium]|jgi:dTDP-glucose 4,6-dehydratase|nr:UDP-glucuronic acid decarboxylase family protein [Verrucomicrobiae bacterium]